MSKNYAGFSLVEMVVGSAVFAIIAVSVFQTYSGFVNLVSLGKYKVLATDIVNEQFELVRNMKYADVGIKNSIPNGLLVGTTTIFKGGVNFDIVRTIRNMDDPFDGQVGSTTNDLSPADYKLLQVDVSCSGCKNFQPISVTGRISPKNLETASNNGALFIKVFDANGNPVPQAQVHVVNVATTTIVIDDETNNQGLLAIVDAPPGVKAYRISVTKPGFSTDRTYATSSANPNPTNPDATVINQQVSQVSFIIDKLSTGNFTTMTRECSAIANVPFTLHGSKLIGTPNVLKFNNNYTTDSSGQRNISNLEWDTFSVAITDPFFYLAGINPPQPFSLLPNSSQNIDLVLTNESPAHLLVTVLDAATQLPVSGASLTLTKSGFSDNTLTGRGYLEQTDWSSGAEMSDGNVEIANPVGDLKLKLSLGVYAVSGNLTSSVFDTGTSSNFGNITWSPTSQPPQAGVNPIKFQIATAPENTATTTWNFAGPDGTATTFYTTSDTNINTLNNGNRYFRYKVYLTTADTTATPDLANVAFTFTSSCIPPGQAIFSSLSNGNYNLNVSETGYTSQDVPVTINSSWTSQNIIFSPN